VRRRPILHDFEDDRISRDIGNETRLLSLMSALRAEAVSSVARPPSAFPNDAAGRSEHARDVTVQRSHDADPREHRRPAQRRDQDQPKHRSLPPELD
jgi:hypothetical protein